MMLSKPYYDHGGITIYHGDCREILPSLGRFDLVLADPPYGVGIDTDYRARKRGQLPYGRGSLTHPPVAGDDKPFDPTLLLAASDNRVLWGANNYADKLPISPMWLAWDRVAQHCHTTDVELAWVSGLRFTTVRLFRHQWVGVLRDSEHGHTSLHPTQKPVALMSWCLDFFPKAKTVIDPYMGSGPIAKACKDRGLRYVGIELVETYCERAVARLAQESLLF